VSNRVIVITGGSSGIGKATAKLFAEDGEHVVILNRNEKAGAETVAELQAIGGSVLYVKTDISSESQVEAAFAKAVEKFGKVDILFANAAIQINKPVDETTKEDWDLMIGANLTGTFLCCKAAAKYMKKQKSGSIIICSSGHAFMSYPGYTGYAATKGGQVAFMHACAIDLAPYGIRVNCIIPGATESPLLTYHFSKHPEDEQRILQKIPLGRFATGEDIAKGVRFLASPDASYVAGSCLMVEGGLLAQG
jgi:NAD(P)-dependent dehydrogenase (short-subunit alcohol dehydrogenase family)